VRREYNYVVKKGRPGDVRVAIAYPSTYRAALSSLAYQMLYYYVNSRDGFIAERFHIEKPSGFEPPPRSVERGSELRRAELILFSVHHEPDYVNIIRLLEAGGVPALSNEREKHIVVVGGPPVIANPEPLAQIADVIVIGEIEATLPMLLDAYLEHRGDRKGFFESLPPEKGFYVPVLDPSEVKVAYVERLPLEFHPIAQIQPLDTEPLYGRSTLIEAVRGCSRLCRFCMEGYVFFPARERPLSQVLEIAFKGAEYNRVVKATLIAPSFFDHKEADRILEKLVDGGLEVSVPSVRLDTLNEERLELMVAGGQRTLTVAPETASLRLCRIIGKPFSEEDLVRTARAAKRAGINGLKLYFMIGLPGETMDDVKGIAGLVSRVGKEAGFKGGRELKVSVTPFIPKPGTPMQWLPMERPGVLRAKIRFLKELLGGLADVRVYDVRLARIQAAISRADARMGRLLIAWARAGGGLGGWRRALRRNGVAEESLLKPPKLDGEVPWNRVRTGTSHMLRMVMERYLG